MIVVDADHISYRAASSCEPTKAKPFLESKEMAVWRLHSMIEQLEGTFNTNEMEFHLGGEGNWRKQIYPEYKANRKDMKRPTYIEDVREILVAQYNAKVINDMEVDDVCGIRMTQLQAEGLSPVCVSLDKDLLQIPGKHYNFVKQKHTFVSPLDGLRSFYKQVITGDASDNVPAFDGKFRTALPKFVAALLQPLDSMTEEVDMWNYVVEQYENFYGNPLSPHAVNMAKRNASVLYIKRTWEDEWQVPGQKED
jgi:5'-3' exonuclease